MSTQKDVINFRKRQKQNIIYVMGGKCFCCGYNKCNNALELHHLNPKEKDFTFSDNNCRAWNKVVAELPKTILVCANCHREIHANLIDAEKLKSSFDQSKANEISQKVEQTKKGIYFCKDCGSKITPGATYCSACYAKNRQTVERPTREQLKKDIRSMPMVQVGKKYKVSDNSIRKWCKKMELPYKVSEIKTYTDEEWEEI